MAKITWLGEDEAHQKEDGSGAGPRGINYGGYRFDKGKPVSVTDPHVIQKAIGNRFFDVEMTAAEPMPEPADHAPEIPKRRPGRPPRVKPNAIASNAT